MERSRQVQDVSFVSSSSSSSSSSCVKLMLSATTNLINGGEVGLLLRTWYLFVWTFNSKVSVTKMPSLGTLQVSLSLSLSLSSLSKNPTFDFYLLVGI